MTEEARAELRADLVSRIPRWYSPWGHLAFPAVTGVAIAAFALSRIEDLRGWQLALVPLFLVAANAIEWHAHRGLLHRTTRPLEQLYVHHAPQHHRIYVSEDMAIRGWRELKLVLMPPWAVLAIVTVSSPVAFAFALAEQPNAAALWVASAVAYVLSYEALHLAYHLPVRHPIARLRVTRWLRRHHQLHHAPERMQRWNFNVTLPLWDLVRGTAWREGREARKPPLALRATEK